MLALLLVLLIVFLLFGFGFSLHFLWIAAVVVAVIWLLGFAIGPRGPPGTGGGRWYYW